MKIKITTASQDILILLGEGWDILLSKISHNAHTNGSEDNTKNFPMQTSKDIPQFYHDYFINFYRFFPTTFYDSPPLYIVYKLTSAKNY
jgi:hypothetical protein